MAEVKSRIIENFGFYHFTKKNTLLIAARNTLRPSKGPFKELLNSMQQNFFLFLTLLYHNKNSHQHQQ